MLIIPEIIIKDLRQKAFVSIYRNFLDKKSSYLTFNYLLNNIPWTKYNHSLQIPANKITELSHIQEHINNHFPGARINTALLNHYPTGKEVFKNKTDENIKSPFNYLFNLTLCSRRQYVFADKFTGVEKKVILYNGDLMVIWGTFKNNYIYYMTEEPQHSFPHILIGFKEVNRKQKREVDGIDKDREKDKGDESD